MPNLLARLRGTPVRLEEAVGGLPRDLLIARTGGAWSALEHAGHLSDLESLWLARLDDLALGREQLTPADLSNRATHEANHNARAPEELLAEFRRRRAALLSRVVELDERCFGRALPHPRLGTPMGVADHLYIVAEHDDHHLARIYELAARP